MTITTEMQNCLEQVESILDNKGFDSYEVREIGYRPFGYRAGFFLDIHTEDGSHVEYIDVKEPTWGECLVKLNEVKSREYRDLGRVAAKLSELEGMTETLSSVYAAQLLADIKERALPLHTMLSDLRGES